MATKTQPNLIDERLLKAMAHPIRQHILDQLGEGPSSPVRMQRRMENVSLNLVSHHIKVLKDLGCIELVETVKRRGATEHIYRANRRFLLSEEEWKRVDPSQRAPITANLLRFISDDTGRAFAEGKMDERDDNHISRSVLELDDEGWSEVVETLKHALDDILEANVKSAERARESGEDLKPSRVMIMQFPIGRRGQRED